MFKLLLLNLAKLRFAKPLVKNVAKDVFVAALPLSNPSLQQHHLHACCPHSESSYDSPTSTAGACKADFTLLIQMIRLLQLCSLSLELTAVSMAG